MQAHIEQCVFGNVECPYLPCQEKMPLGNIVGHLKNTNKAIETKHREPNADRIFWPVDQQTPNQNYKAIIHHFDGHCFIFNCNMKDSNMTFWTIIVGSEEDAQRYKVSMSISGELVDGATKTLGKVYSIEMTKTDVLKSTSGILEISPKMITMVGRTWDNGRFCVCIDYNIGLAMFY